MNGQRDPVYVFAEPDYCYGIGPLTMRVEQIDWSDPQPFEGEDWYYVEGIEIDRTGVERGQRRVLVRGRRLPVDPTMKRA